MTMRRHSLLAFDPVDDESARHATARARGRILLLIAVVAVIYGYLTHGLMQLALGGAEAQRAARHSGEVESAVARRDIVDRHGTVLATNLRVWTLYVNPKVEVNTAEVVARLTKIFPDLSATRLTQQLTSGKHVPLRYDLSAREAQAVHELGIPALYVRKDLARLYPSGRAFPHVLGDVDRDGGGVAGIEAAFDSQLRGQGGQAPLRLSVDLRVQMAARAVVQHWWPKLTPKAAAVVVMDIHTGEVHALLSMPDFDGNRRPLPDKENPTASPLFNHATQGVYELGSTFKSFTWAMALHFKVAGMNSHFDTTVPVVMGGHSFGEPYFQHPNMPFDLGLIKSSNRMAVHLARLTGAERQKQFLESLGLLNRSTIELPEQSQPILPRMNSGQGTWADVSAATVAFGHGISISPLQMAAGYATLVNGGVRVRPTLLADPPPRPAERVISAETSALMRQILRDTVLEGTGRKAAMISYQVGGKTGTANKPTHGGYDEKRVLASFAAFFPASQPRYVVVLTLDEPSDPTQIDKYQRTAGNTAVPVAAALIERIAPMLGIMPDNTARGEQP